MPTPQAVIFDMDGTLIDTERVSQTAWRRAAADLGLDVPERIWNAFLVPREGALEALRTLADAGMTLALATTTAREHALKEMERFGMAPFFSTMTFGDEIERSKPAPDIYFEAARRLGVAPEVCAAVEDSMNGARAALAAGMATFLVPEWAEATPDVADACAAVLGGLAEVPAAILGRAAVVA